MEEKLYPVDLKYRVALDLMLAIADEEDQKIFAKPDPRTYYFNLYAQCLKVVSEHSADEASNAQ